MLEQCLLAICYYLKTGRHDVVCRLYIEVEVYKLETICTMGCGAWIREPRSLVIRYSLKTRSVPI